MKILLVDDCPDIVDLLTLKLQERGHEVKSFTKGKAALNRGRFDLIITDYDLGNFVGTRIIRHYQLTPSIIFSASDPVPMWEHCWVSKNDPDKLFARVDSIAKSNGRTLQTRRLIAPKSKIPISFFEKCFRVEGSEAVHTHRQADDADVAAIIDTIDSAYTKGKSDKAREIRYALQIRNKG